MVCFDRRLGLDDKVQAVHGDRAFAHQDQVEVKADQEYDSWDPILNAPTHRVILINKR